MPQRAKGITFSPIENQNNGVRFVTGLMAGVLVVRKCDVFALVWNCVSTCRGLSLAKYVRAMALKCHAGDQSK